MPDRRTCSLAKPVSDTRFGDFSRESVEHIENVFTTQVHGNSGKLKIVRYDVRKLVSYSAIVAMFVKGTVFNLDYSVYISMAKSFTIFMVVLLYAYFSVDEFEANDDARKSMDSVIEISEAVQAFTPFALGMYTSIVLKRWWQLRTEAIGQISEHCIISSGMLVALASRVLLRDEDWQRFEASHSKFVRYGIASLSCISMESRDVSHKDELEKLVDRGILDEWEVEILMETPSAATGLWCWMSALGGEILEMMKIANPQNNCFYQELREALCGIHSVHHYIRTQLPYPYVHMITFIVNCNNFVIALVAGMHCGIGLQKKHYAVCFSEMLQGMLVPILYQGLMQITVFLSDPLGDDIIDFPIFEYQLEVCEECLGQLVTRKFYENRFGAGLSPLPNAHVIQSLGESKDAPVSPPAANVQTEETRHPKPVIQPESVALLNTKLKILMDSVGSLAASMDTVQKELDNPRPSGISDLQFRRSAKTVVPSPFAQMKKRCEIIEIGVSS